MFPANSKADTPLYEFLVRHIRGEHLSFKDSTEFFRALTDRDANRSQIAGCPVAMGSKGKSWVVHGSDGLDELTLDGETFVAEVTGNKIKTFEITPEDFGLQRADLKNLKVKNAVESAKMVTEVLESKRRDEARNLIVINTVAALLIGGKSKTPMHAAHLAEQNIDSGSARIKLDRLVQTTNKK